MPEISRFYGLLIRMYVERGERHHLPHFHALYQGKSAVYRIDTAEMIGGYLPLRQRRLVEAWVELHRDELLAIGSDFSTTSRRFGLRRWNRSCHATRTL